MLIPELYKQQLNLWVSKKKLTVYCILLLLTVLCILKYESQKFLARYYRILARFNCLILFHYSITLSTAVSILFLYLILLLIQYVIIVIVIIISEIMAEFIGMILFVYVGCSSVVGTFNPVSGGAKAQVCC